MIENCRMYDFVLDVLYPTWTQYSMWDVNTVLICWV
jgi:hypothetical protein